MFLVRLFRCEARQLFYLNFILVPFCDQAHILVGF
nr:MAG TPA: zinc finger protein [Caudoviricetes sp.]